MWLPGVDGVVAGLADVKGLAPPPRHQFRPRGPWLSRLAEVGELADLVHMHLAAVPADLAPVRQEPGDQLLMADDARDKGAIGDDRILLPPERNAAEPCDQWLPAAAFDLGLQALAWPVRCVDDGLVLAGHLRHRRAVLVRQGLQQRGL